MNNFTARYAHARLAATRREDLVQPKKIHGLSAEQNGPYGARDGRIAARVQSGLGVLRRHSAQSGGRMGYLSSLIGNPRVSGYLEHHHPEILTEFRAIVTATSLEESGSGASEEPVFLA